jgi:hypothetical protein
MSSPTPAPTPSPAPTPTPAPTPAAPSTPSPSSNSPDFFSAIESHFAEPASTPNAPTQPTEKKEASTPKEADTPAASKPASPKAKDFDVIKTQRDEARNELTTLQTTLKDLQAKLAAAEATTTEFSSLREKATVQEKELAAVNVAKSPEYQEAVEKPAAKIRDATNKLMARYKLDNSRVLDAFAESDPGVQNELVSELASTMNARDQFQFYQLVDDFNAVASKREELQSRSQEAWQEIQHKRTQEQEAAKKAGEKSWKEAEGKVWNAFETRVPQIKALGNIESIRNQVQTRHISELSVEEQAYSAMAGLFLPGLVKELSSSQGKIHELETSLAKFTQATPGAGGGGSSSNMEDDTSSGGFLDQIERRFSGG